MDKNQAIIDFLFQCPQLRDNPTFFNFINAKDNNKQIVTTSNDKILDTSFIDGSVEKQFTFTIIDFKSIEYNALVNQEGYEDENVVDILDTQAIINWINEQDDLRNYPNFGSDCIIDEMKTTNDNPSIAGVDSSVQPTLAKYSINIQIKYIDNSKKLWY